MTFKAAKKYKKLLIITSSAGGGHIQAAKAEAVKALVKNPDTIIIERDIMIDCLGKYVGKAFSYLWNFSQKKGNLFLLGFFSKNTPVADILFYLHIFFHIFTTIVRNDVDQIIDTQPLGTPATIHAIKWAQKFLKKDLILEKIVTELPTDKVIHFFKPIKNIAKKNHQFIKLISAPPLLDKNQTAGAFWQKHCGLSEHAVQYETFPLRPEFTKYKKQKLKNNEKIKIQIEFSSSEEKYLITNTVKKGSLKYTSSYNSIIFYIEPTDKVSTILLGSQPTEEATVNYIKRYIRMMRDIQVEQRHLLFVFCNHHIKNKNTLLKKAHDLIQKTNHYPVKLNIIPMCFQNDEVIAPLYFRSDATFTRSGGLTSMELMTIAQGQIWIHSEIKYNTQNEKKLCKGMPIWERGNAKYLQEKKGARFITPDSFNHACSDFFLPKQKEPEDVCMSV